MSDKNDFLGTESVGKLLFRLSLPAVTAEVVNMFYNIVDRVYIGHIKDIGTHALTGVGVCLPVIMIISAFAALVSMGAAPKASIAMGQGDNKKAEKILGNSFMLLIIVSIILSLVFLIYGERVLYIFGASKNTIVYASRYMKIYVLGTIFVQLALGMNAFITAQGFAKTSMLTIIIGALCNIILDPIFIFAFDMGVAGAALATIISQCISAIWVIYFLTSKNTILKIKKENMKLDSKIIIPCIVLGLSPFIMQATESLISLCFNSSLLKYGGDIAVGAMTILSSVMQFAMLPLRGLTQGCQPIVSYNFGARNSKRVKEAFFNLLKVSLTYSTCLWVIVMIFPSTLIKMFTSDVNLLNFTVTPMRIYMAVSLLFSIQISCQQTFIAIGNAKTSLFLAVFRKIIILIPLIYILPALISNKTMAVYLAEPVADFIAVCTTATMFFFQFRKALRNCEKQSII